MARGSPDYQNRQAETALPLANTSAGQSIEVYSFTGSITAGASGSVDVTAPSTGYEQVYPALVVSCEDDEAIHEVRLTRIPSGWVMFLHYFTLNLVVQIPSAKALAADSGRVTMYNNHADDKIFKGVIYYINYKV